MALDAAAVSTAVDTSSGDVDNVCSVTGREHTEVPWTLTLPFSPIASTVLKDRNSLGRQIMEVMQGANGRYLQIRLSDVYGELTDVSLAKDADFIITIFDRVQKSVTRFFHAVAKIKESHSYNAMAYISHHHQSF